jgi:hypothetical protein
LVSTDEFLHDLDLTEDTLVVTVKDTTERSKRCKTQSLLVVVQTSPSLLIVGCENSVEIAASCGTSTHVDM